MIIGVPKEIKNNENRVALTPAGALELSKRGHAVYVQATAGVSSGFSDDEYVSAGAKILPTIEDVYGIAEMIIKVKEPIEQEYPLIQPDQLLFTYFHFASYEPLTRAMIASDAICLAYETVELPDRSLPLLVPMSEVAGRMAIQEGAKYLEKPAKGRGVLLGGVPGVPPGRVLVIGGGIVGMQAAKMAAGLGAQVTLLDVSLPRLRYLADVMPANVTTIYSNEYNIRKLVRDLAARLSTRIELRQIGARDAAARVGGLGSCGRELCCSTWLQEFKPVSTTAAKFQSLPLNLTRLSGQCGRLKCCLNYELEQYIEALNEYPDIGISFNSPNGRAYITKLDIFKQLVWFELQDGSFDAMPLTEIRKILRMDTPEGHARAKRRVFGQGGQEEEELRKLED